MSSGLGNRLSILYDRNLSDVVFSGNIYIYIYICIYLIYIYIYKYIYGNHKTLSSHHGCSYIFVVYPY